VGAKANATNMNAPTGSSGRPGNCTNCIDSWDGGRQKQIPWRNELGLSYRLFGPRLVVVLPGKLWNGLHSKIFAFFFATPTTISTNCKARSVLMLRFYFFLCCDEVYGETNWQDERRK